MTINMDYMVVNQKCNTVQLGPVCLGFVNVYAVQ